MADRADIVALRDRVLGLTGPDREVDAALALLAGWTHEKRKGDQRPYWRSPEDPPYGADGWQPRRDLPFYTASVDAALALAERVSHKNGMKLICFFCAGGQLMPDNADETDPDYHPLAKIDNSVTVGWLSHVAFYKSGGSETYGPERYTHARTPALAIIAALLSAIAERGE